MSTTALQAFDASAWKQAYSAALFETDKSKINSLIVAAEVAIALRARELFGAEGDHSRGEGGSGCCAFRLAFVARRN